MSFFSGKRILLISPEPWGRSMLSKHQYAGALAREGARVYFLTPPGIPGLQGGGSVPTGVTLVEDRYIIRGSHRLPAPLRRWLVRRAVRRLEDAIGGPADLIWSFDNSRWFDLDLFHADRRIHHVMDFHADAHLEEAARTSDLAIGVTQGIVDRLRRSQPNSHFVPHGYSAETDRSVELPAVPQAVRALYAGNLLHPFIDWSWMLRAAAQLPQIHFFLVGSTGGGNLNRGSEVIPPELDMMRTLPNVSFLGEQPLPLAQAWMEEADILFLAYRHREFPESLSNSLKIMSYLGSGKVVVGNPTAVYRDHPELLIPCTDADSFVRTMAHVASNLGEFNNPEIMRRRREYAMGHTYGQLLGAIGKLLQA